MPGLSRFPGCADAVAEQLAHQQRGIIPARVPGTEHADTGMHAQLNGARQAGTRRRHGRAVNPPLMAASDRYELASADSLVRASVSFLRSREREANRAQGVIRRCFPYPPVLPEDTGCRGDPPPGRP